MYTSIAKFTKMAELFSKKFNEGDSDIFLIICSDGFGFQTSGSVGFGFLVFKFSSGI